MSDDNLLLWDSVCTPESRFVTKKSYGAGLSEINPQYTIRKVTEQWGPYGKDWGMKDLQFERIEVGGKNYLVLQAVIWFPGGEYPVAASTEMVWGTDGDPYKSVVTSARSKGLSWLGFEGDVYMGLMDGSAKPAPTKPVPRKPPQTAPKGELSEPTMKKMLTKIANKENLDLTEVRRHIDNLQKAKGISDNQVAQINEAIAQREQKNAPAVPF